MSLALALMFATAPDLKHGTFGQCEKWYPNDWRKIDQCTDLTSTLAPAQRARFSDLHKKCGELVAFTKARGLSFDVLTLRDKQGEFTCHGSR